MQKILGLDIAGKNVVAAVFAVEGDCVSTLEHYTMPLNKYLTNAEDNTIQDNEAPYFLNLSETLKEVVKNITNTYSRSILIIPPVNCLSTDIELPFSNQKTIEKVLELEIQDLVSLDVKEFHVAPSIVDDYNNNDFTKIHVGMIPRRFMDEIISETNKAGLEPFIITTRATAISALYYINNNLSNNSAIISLTDNILSITASCDGTICYDRAIQLEDSVETLNKDILQDIKIAIYSLEKQYKIKIDSIYTLNENLIGFLKNAQISKNITLLNSTDNKISVNDDFMYLYLASIFARDFNPPRILTNFRCRQFSYKLQFNELRRGFFNILPLLIISLLIVSLFLFVKYELLDYRIQKTRLAIQQTIQEFIPDFSKENQATIENVMLEHAELEKELKNLSTNAVMSPLEAFKMISEDFSIINDTKKDISISQLHITQKDAKFTIETADYKGMGAVERQFKRRHKQQYCKIESKDKSSLHATRKSFEFLVEFCKK